jgi:hypothetical protein
MTYLVLPSRNVHHTIFQAVTCYFRILQWVPKQKESENVIFVANLYAQCDFYLEEHQVSAKCWCIYLYKHIHSIISEDCNLSQGNFVT